MSDRMYECCDNDAWFQCRPGEEHPCITEKHACTKSQYCNPRISSVNGNHFYEYSSQHINKYDCIDQGTCDNDHIKCDDHKRAGCLNVLRESDTIVDGFMTYHTIQVHNLAECFRYCDKIEDCVAFDVTSKGLCAISNKICPDPDPNKGRPGGRNDKTDYYGFYYQKSLCAVAPACKRSRKMSHDSSTTAIIGTVFITILALFCLVLTIDLIFYFKCQSGIIFAMRYGRRPFVNEIQPPVNASFHTNRGQIPHVNIDTDFSAAGREPPAYNFNYSDKTHFANQE